MPDNSAGTTKSSRAATSPALCQHCKYQAWSADILRLTHRHFTEVLPILQKVQARQNIPC